jgi:hypothetical protein
MVNWTFLSNHGRSLLCIARDPDARLRDIAATLGITERSAYGIVNDLVDAGYVVKTKEGRRNRYQIQTQMPLPELTSQEQAIGDVLGLLAGGAVQRKHQRRSGRDRRAPTQAPDDSLEREERRTTTPGPKATRTRRS